MGISTRVLCSVAALAMTLALQGCKGSDGKDGLNGANGSNGTDGTNGTNGTNGGNVQVALFHGQSVVTALDELQGAPANPKYLANITITSASADAAGVAKVNFTVKGKDGLTPVTGITACSAGIFKLEPAETGARNFNRWVPYIYRTGRTVNAGYRESTTSTPVHGTLVENGTGTGNYTYTFGTNLSTAAFAFPVNGQTLVGYDRSLTHRVSIYMGGHSGPTGEADFDFVPNGGAVTATRNIVDTATCKKCHGPEFHGHGGDRVTVEGCNTCHSPDSFLANTAANGGKTESIAMQIMIHKIHAGRELTSVAGPDGQFYDNPNTVADETADNGIYRLGNESTWNTAAFPAVLANCVACHTGSGAQVDNWKNVPSRESCGSCHDTTTFTDTPTAHTHTGPAQANDDNCTGCHDAATIEGYHAWTTKDPRNTPEFKISLTTDTPTRGYYIAGEKPVITIVLTDAVTNTVLDHTTIVQDPTGEGCIPNATKTDCTVARDGLFTAANVYVTGPRAERVPVLTYAARAKVTSTTAGPWDLSAGGNIRVRVDSGTSMLTYNNAAVYEGYGADELIAGDFTLTLPAASTAFANPAAATAAEVAAWLNADPTFSERAIAYVDEKASVAGRLSLRSRGIMQRNPAGEVVMTTAQRNIQVVSSTLGIFSDLAIKTAGSAGIARIQTTASDTDPKATFTAANIKYTLDSVDDLVPGTYVVNLEFADRGRAPAPANPAEPPYVDYKTPSVAVATFQVKTATAETPVAGNCTACHWSSANVGFVLDYPRHNKLFNEQALDQCGGCHDYASGMKGDVTTQASWSGGLAISKRVHAVHNGAALVYPTLTVGHEETAAFGRNWRITYPQDVRNCESCHPAGGATTDGWTTKANRLACMGCHDADAATSHMKLQVWDPTPLAAFSGDEVEACVTCH